MPVVADRAEEWVPWWRHAVFYQVYLRSFADSDGDGLGDLPGLRSRLPYLARLGVDAVWISPCYPSPDFDHGYDVADHRSIDPRYGTLDDLDAFVADAHAAGMRVLLDLVPNHTSSEHVWFANARADRDHPDRRRYIWADDGVGGGPPNNWLSVFGGPAWTRDDASGQWYLHLFAPEQPDLNWRQPAVADDFDDIVRFWLDRDVDGFRIDVAHGLLKDADLRDNPWRDGAPPDVPSYASMEQRHTFDVDDVHEVHRRWRRLVDAYPGDRVLLGEVLLANPDPARMARYLRPDELHRAFAFHLLHQPWSATAFRASIDATRRELDPIGATATWVLSNHDVVRHATRYGGGPIGVQRARAAAVLVLGLPGSACLYQGDELGLEHVDVPPEARQDPIYRLGGGTGRDGCRVPIPWTRGGGPGFGFTAGVPWLPTPAGWGEQSVEAEDRDSRSTLALYRRLLAVRRSQAALHGDTMAWMEAPDGCLAFRRVADGAGVVDVVVNLGDDPVEVAARGACCWPATTR